MARILIPLPAMDFDPTEASVPWKKLTTLGHEVCFATPEGQMAEADPRMIKGSGLGIWKPLLIADKNGLNAYSEMIASSEFQKPWDYERAATEHFDGLILPGGHAQGMRKYLESKILQGIVVQSFERDIPVGAICHGVVLAARATNNAGRSVLYGRKTTALNNSQELTAWMLTVLWLGNYYRTYPETVQDEVSAALADPNDFDTGPFALFRDSSAKLSRGFTVKDGNYLSARWPGDAHRFADEYASMLGA